MAFGPEEAKALLAEVFAPWVAEMGLEPLLLGPDAAVFRLPPNDRLALKGGPGAGVLCGQAVGAVADTVSVLALAGANGRFRICTTTDLSVSFLRPVMGAAEAEVEVVRNGKQMAVCRVTVRAGSKPAAVATASFLYLEE